MLFPRVPIIPVLVTSFLSLLNSKDPVSSFVLTHVLTLFFSSVILLINLSGLSHSVTLQIVLFTLLFLLK